MSTEHPRREFLKRGAVVGGAAAVGAVTLFETNAAFAARLREKGRGRVVGVEHPAAMKSLNKESRRLVERMTNEAIKRFTGKRTVAKAWREFVSPADVVGVKLNCLASPGMGTSPGIGMAWAA